MKKGIFCFALGLILIFPGAAFALAGEYVEGVNDNEAYNYYEEQDSYDDVILDYGAQSEASQEESPQAGELVEAEPPIEVSVEEASVSEDTGEEAPAEETKKKSSNKKKNKKKKNKKEKNALELPPAKDGDVFCDTLREAKMVAGFRLAAPRSLSGYEVRGIYAHEGLVEVCYLGENGQMLSFFKSNLPIEVGAEIYQDEKSYDVDNIWLTMSGEKPTYYKASWEEDGYYFVILSSEGMTDTLIEEYFDEIA